MAVNEHRLTIGVLIASAVRLIGLYQISALSAFVALTVIFVASDMLIPTEQQLRMQGVLSIASVAIAYAVTIGLLKATSSDPSAIRSRVGAYIVLSIVTGVITLLGLILLIVPGLFIAARWALAAPILLAEGRTIGESMKESWARTATNWWPLVAVQIALVVLMIAAAILVGISSGSEALSLIGSIATNATVSLFTLGSVVLAVAAYRELSEDDARIAAVFA